MSASKQRKMLLLTALVLSGGVLAFVSMGSMGENLVYFWEPVQLEEAGEDAVGATVRLGGVVEEGSVDWNEESQDLRFTVTDGKASVAVYAQAAPPQMFRAGIGVVVEGKLQKDGVFHCDRVMVKHSNEYRAPEEGVDSKELYRTLEEI